MILEIVAWGSCFTFLGMGIQDKITQHKYRKTKSPLKPIEACPNSNPTVNQIIDLIVQKNAEPIWHRQKWYGAYATGLVDAAFTLNSITAEEARILQNQINHCFLLSEKSKADQTECCCPKPHPVSQVETDDDVCNR